MHGLKITMAVAAASLLAACASSKPDHYYTLLSPAPAAQASSGAGAGQPAFAISVQTVRVPEQVDKPQIVVSDPGSTQVIPLNNSLWASPLSDEIRGALSDGISRRLGVVDVAVTGAPEQLPVWRITMNVQRFDSVYGERVFIDATWRLSPVRQPGRKTALCRAEARAEVGPGMSALVAGHQAAMEQLAGLIAKQLRGDGTAESGNGLTVKGCTFS
jgi:uncharacterized lipoprotein YmbA